MGADRIPLGSLAVISRLLMNPRAGGVAGEKIEDRLEWQSSARTAAETSLFVYMQNEKDL